MERYSRLGGPAGEQVPAAETKGPDGARCCLLCAAGIPEVDITAEGLPGTGLRRIATISKAGIAAKGLSC